MGSKESKLIRIYNVCNTSYAVLHGLVDMKVTCICLLKIASDSDGNLFLLLGELFKYFKF